MTNPKTSNVEVIDSIHQLCNADERGRMDALPRIATETTIDELEKIMEEMEQKQ